MADDADHQDKIQQFCGVTGAPEDFALTFLVDSGWNLEASINAYMVTTALPPVMMFCPWRIEELLCSKVCK
jgi:hypothetical protein